MMMQTVKSLSIIIPVFDEEEGLPALFAALQQFISTLTHISVEVIFVNDHSSDSSLACLHQACATNPLFKAINLSKRCGSHIAIIAGLSKASGDVAVFVAADLQDPLEMIPKMIERHENGADIVWAVRDGAGEISWLDAMTSRIFYELMRRVSNIGTLPYQASFALLSRRSYQTLVRDAPPRASLIVEIPRIGFDVATISFRKPRRIYGRSKWSLGRKIMAFADAVVSSSYLPLRSMAYIGIVVSLIGFLLAAIIMLRWVTGISPPQGWASLMVSVLILGGLQMLMLGIIGEYLWRTNENAGRRSLFHIQDVYGSLVEAEKNE